ncbi:MAG: helix-turn-helix transcriptional regulator [Planctomycetota bacterium]
MFGFILRAVKRRPVEKSIYTPEYDRFRELLIELRSDRDLTQTDLARRLGDGWTQTKVSKCERGERRLDIIEVRRWCHALGVSFPEFAKMLHGALPTMRSRGK